MPAQFLCADGLSVPPSIKTSELNTLVCNVKEAYVMMCDGKRRKCQKHGKQCTCCILSQTGRIVLRKLIRLLDSLITYNSTYKYVVFLSL